MNKIGKCLSIGGVMVVIFFLCQVGLAQLQPPQELEAQKTWLLQECNKAKIDWQQFKGETITVAMNRHWYTESLEPFIPVFERLTGIKVLMEIYSEEEFYTKVPIDLASGAGIFDVFMQGMSFVLAQYVEAGWLEPLDQYLLNPKLTDLKWWDIEDFTPGINAGKYDVSTHKYATPTGTTYAIPISFECQQVLYRKDIFENLGLTPPATMDDLKTMAAKMNNPPKMYGIVNRGRRTFSGVWGWAGYFRSFGGQWFDKNWTPIFNNENGVKSIEFYTNLLLKYGPPGIQNIDWYECMSLMQTGKVGIVTDASGWIGSVVDPEKSIVYDKVGVFRFPKGPVRSEPNTWYWEIAMNRSSKHKNAAWLFIMWATSKPTTLLTALRNGAPPRSGTWKNPLFVKTIGEKWPPGYVDAVSYGLKYGSPESSLPAIKEGPEIGDRVGIALGQIFEGVSAKKALDDAAKDVMEIMKKGGYIK